MLAIKKYSFMIGTKIPFADYPRIVKDFLDEQELHYENFLYYFEDNDGGLSKISKDCPNIGPVRSYTNHIGERFYLSNIEEATGCSEAEILAVVPKIHRRYKIYESYIVYQDVDFFSNNIKSVFSPPVIKPDSVKGNSIRLFRDSVFPRLSRIELNIVIYDGAKNYDATPYFEAMKRLLPNIRHMESLDFYMTGAERSAFDEMDQKALPVLSKARDYFKEHLPISSEPNEITMNVPAMEVAPVLKKLCKQYGYAYGRYVSGCFLVKKQTSAGNYIILDIDVGPVFKRVDSYVRFEGLGFDYEIGSNSRYLQSKEQIDEHFLQIFSTLKSAEKDVFPALDACFPQTPDWYSPAL